LIALPQRRDKLMLPDSRDALDRRARVVLAGYAFATALATLLTECIVTGRLLLTIRPGWDRMGLRGVLAGLLLDGPAHGYQLQATLAAELGPLWVTRASQVYLTLGRMQRDGLVTARRVRQSTRPDRQLLELTARGRAAALEWLERPGPADEVVVRLAVARLALPNRFRDLTETVLTERSAALRSLRELRDEVDGGGFQREAVEAEIFRTQAEVRWLAGVRDRGEELAAAPRGRRAKAGGGRLADLA
jgi:DNA-binding PadR family transcriptional regulator